MPNLLKDTYLIEGRVEQDPLTDLCYLAVPQENGEVQRFDVQTCLASLVGKEVRFTLASVAALDAITSFLKEDS